MRKLAVMTLVAVFALSLAVPAMARIDMTGQVTSRVQQIDDEANTDIEMGFQEALANVQIMGDVASGVSAFAELQYDGSAMTDPVDVNEAYITLDELAGPVDVKMGQFEVNFGNQKNYYSDNADVQSNPLVGNPIVTPVSVEQGLELSGVYGPAAWSLGYTNGTDYQFAQDSEMAMSAKVWGDLTPLAPGLSAALSYYSVDQSDNGSTPMSKSSKLLAGDLASAPYSSVNVGVGEDTAELTAMQLDLGYDLAEFGVPANLTAFYGTTEGASDDLASYMSVEGTYDLTPAAGLALRWGSVDPEQTDESVELIQAGLNYEVAPGTLAKLEYVDRTFDENATTELNNFDGVVGELSVSF